MSIQNTVTKNTYKGDGTTRTFPYTFAMDDDHPEYIHVYITDSDGKAAETDDFTVDVKAQSVTYPKDEDESALKDGEKITIIRQLPLVQILNLVNQGPFFAEDLEQEYDDIVMMIQQLNETLGRAVVAEIGSATTAEEMIEKIHNDAMDAKTYAQASSDSASAAGASAIAAKASEDAAGVMATNAEEYATKSSDSASLAEAWAISTESPDNAADADSPTGLTQSSRSWALYSKDMAASAALSAADALASETSAKESETNAKASEENAADSAKTALDVSDKVQAYIDDAVAKLREALRGSSVEIGTEEGSIHSLYDITDEAGGTTLGTIISTDKVKPAEGTTIWIQVA